MGVYYHFFYYYSPASSLSLSSRGLAPPNIEEAWLVAASEFTGSLTVRGSSTSLGRPDVSGIHFFFIINIIYLRFVCPSNI